ncbi:MAG: glycosyltransferase, partial [Bacteroidota bacterium]
GETSRDMFERAAELSNPNDIIIRMDCDDTHEPKYMLDMIKKIDEGFDVVIASRFQPGGGQHGLDGYRKFISRCANIFMKIFFPIKGVWEYSCGYRAYRASIIQDALKIYGNDFISLKGLGFTCTLEKLVVLRNMKARFAEVPFELHYEQKLSPSKMLSSITTLGYLVLALKYIYPWGPIEKERRKLAQLLYERRIYQENYNNENNGVTLNYVRHLRQA